MGGGEASTPSKPSNASSEQNGAHPYRDWTTMQAYYGSGVSMPPYFSGNVAQAPSPHPYMWAPPILMPPFGAPYSAIYQPTSAYPPQPPDPTGGAATVTPPPEPITGAVVEPKSSAHGNIRALGKETESGSGTEAPSDSQSEGLDSRGEGNKRNFPQENGVGRSAAAGSHLPVHPRLDDREVKKEKRKQSNRESARRSRLRKQAETEELAQKVEALVAENRALRSEVSRLTKESATLKLENSNLQEKLGNWASSAANSSGVTENILHKMSSSASSDRAGSPADVTGRIQEGQEPLCPPSNSLLTSHVH